ncbi:MAG: glycosyltransferase family 39 protein [Candidatus Schekmanbacteria bacterium]|nr:glycosyltransferase family 39 protein [Candidatus Schekmanbacteria bacterium]
MRNKKYFFWITVIILTLFRFWLAGKVLLTGDEAYHWEWSRHLAWGYYDHPPMIAFIIRIGTELFGHTLRAVRGGTVLFSALSVGLVYWLAKDISGREDVGIWAGLLALFCPIYSVGAIITTTDTPHAFFWLLSIYFFYRALFKKNAAAWYLGGVALGAAFLSKFFACFIPLGLLTFLVFSPQQRFWLKRKEPYLAILLAWLIFSPFIYWNATHNWATFGFNLASRHKAPQLTLKYLGEYLGGQSLVLFPAFFVLYLYGLYRTLRQGLGQKEDKSWFLFCTSAPLWLAFLVISTYQRVGAHWPVAAYFSGLVIIAVLLPEQSNWYRRLFKIGWWGSLILMISLYGLVLNPRIIPWNLVYAGWSDKINTGVLREFYGWEELGRRVKKSYAQMSAQAPAFIFTDSYALSSQVAFYTPGNPMVCMLGEGSVHGRNYDFWQDSEQMKGQNALLVSKDGKHPGDSFHLFEMVEAEEPLKIYQDGELVRTFPIFRCYRYLGK